jgi:uncharacterized protein YegL
MLLKSSPASSPSSSSSSSSSLSSSAAVSSSSGATPAAPTNGTAPAAVFPTLDLPLLDQADLVQNPTARVPVVLCLDVSASMSGAPIEELGRGVAAFFDALKADDLACYAAEVAVVTFGAEARLVSDFGALATQEPPALVANGMTPMGKAVQMALDLLDVRKRTYQAAAVDYYQPWLVLMTDGRPTDDVTHAAARTAELVRTRRLSLFPVAIGDNADVGALATFSPTRAPLRLQGLNFAAFFQWLSTSVSRVSQSTPGAAVPLPSLAGWAEV